MEKIAYLLLLLVFLIGCAKDDRPICPICDKRATMQMHPRMSGTGIKSYYKCDNEHNFTKGGVVVSMFGEPLSEDKIKLLKRLESLEAVELIPESELKIREGTYYVKGSNIPYTGKYYEDYSIIGDGYLEGSFKNGKKNGLYTVYNGNLKKIKEGNSKDGKNVGLQTEWHDNGQKKKEVNYKGGKKEGLEIMWHENGQKSGEGNYKDGKKEGLYVWWHENGEKSIEGNYKSGTNDGLGIWWHKNGKKKKEINYKDGKKVGLQTEWHENGQKQMESNYKDGKRIYQKLWNKKGEPVSTFLDTLK
tara:strand:- start:193 stop:1101 length:909 start_codon:yes stop_codon:yes gene_type:complete